MPPKGTEHGTAQTTIRGKRPMPTHVVPAIPFALSKPRSSKQPPNPSANTERPTPITANGDPYTRPEGRTSEHGKQATVIKVENSPRPDDMQKHEGVEDGKANEISFMASSHDVAGQLPSVEQPPLSMQTGQANRPPTPPPTDEGHISSPTVTSSPETVRKPTERFDIRQIRTDLPPAFVPAAEQHTPQSTTSSQSRPQLPARHPTHLHHPSVGSIVFGGRESSTSSPAPTQAATSAFMPSPYATQPGSGHAYHTSESSAPRMFLPGFQPPPPPWMARHGHASSVPHPHPHPAVHIPYRHPPRENFTPFHTPYINGHGLRSRDGSQSSSGAPLDGQRSGPDLQSPTGHDAPPDMYSEPKNAFIASSRQHSANFFPPPPQAPIPFQYPEYAANYENVEALRMHLLNSFSMPELADCQLHILDKQTGARQSLFSHKVILARSPRLLQMIRDNGSTAPSTIHTDVSFALDDGYLRIPALMDSIRYLYGRPLPPFDPYRSGVPTDEPPMQLALQHIAMGAWLQIPAISQRATEMAINFLHWPTLPALLAFALEGGLSPAWANDDGSAERVSTCSSDDSFSRPESGGSPTYDPHSTYFLHRILTFVVFNLPSNFYLDTAAPQLATSPRLPTTAPTHQSRPSRSDPRLSKIRFGEIPADDHQRPSLATTSISSILLSLPFPLLKSLLEHYELTHRLGPETVSSIMRSVVQEREIRRQKALKGYPSVSTNHDNDSYLVQNLYWIESVEASDQHRTGCRLARQRRDIDTPPSSGTDSDRHR